MTGDETRQRVAAINAEIAQATSERRALDSRIEDLENWLDAVRAKCQHKYVPTARRYGNLRVCAHCGHSAVIAECQ